MLNRETGEVTCDYCAKPLGNYLTGDFFRLIRLKYCKNCKEKVRKEQINAAQKAWRKRNQLLNKAQATVIEEMEQMNLLLREQNKMLRDENEALRREQER